MSKPWQRIDPTIITKIDYQNVVVKTFKLPDGKSATRATFLSEGKKAVAVIAVTKDKEVITARQFRPGPERIMDELPGGYVDDGEEPQMAAERELLEETGYQAGSITFLGTFSRDAYVNGQWYYYLATDCTRLQKQQLEDDEFVTVTLLRIPEFIDNARKGRMTDPFAVLAAYDQLNELQKEDKREA